MRRSAELRQDGGRLGHLHQREHALLHAGAAGSRHDHQRVFALGGALPQPGDLLADDRPMRAAHEREVHHTEIDRHVAQRAGDGEHGVSIASVRGGLLEALGVLREAEGIGRPEVRLDSPWRAFVEQNVGVFLGANATMVVAGGAHVQVADELLPQIRVTAGLTLFPDICRDFQPLDTALATRPAGLLILSATRTFQQMSPASGSSQIARVSALPPPPLQRCGPRSRQPPSNSK